MRLSIISLVFILIILGPFEESYSFTFDIWNLVVEDGETVSLNGHIKLQDRVVINGTIEIPDSYGTLIIEAPYIFIGTKGKIDGNGKGYLRGPGKGEDFDDCKLFDMPSGGGYGGRGAEGWGESSFGHTCDGKRESGPAYGAPWFPDVQMGSGGGKAEYSARVRGGGAIKLLASREIIVRGILTVNGGNSDDAGVFWECFSGSGSGGGILISAPRVILNGLFSARGGGIHGGFCETEYYRGGGGGGGRIKICYTDLYRDLFSVFDVEAGPDMIVDGSHGSWNGLDDAEPGTVTILDMKTYGY